jgi:hypothetical protein
MAGPYALLAPRHVPPFFAMTEDDALGVYDQLLEKIRLAQELQQRLGCSFGYAYSLVLSRRKENSRMNFGD